MRSKVYSIKCKDNAESKNKLKGISKPQSKHIKKEKFQKYFDSENYEKERDNSILKSINLEIYLQKLKKKSSLSVFGDKRCCKNNNESNPWI